MFSIQARFAFELFAGNKAGEDKQAPEDNQGNYKKERQQLAGCRPGVIAIDKDPEESGCGPEDKQGRKQGYKKTGYSEQQGIDISFLQFKNGKNVPIIGIRVTVPDKRKQIYIL